MRPLGVVGTDPGVQVALAAPSNEKSLSSRNSQRGSGGMLDLAGGGRGTHAGVSVGDPSFPKDPAEQGLGVGPSDR